MRYAYNPDTTPGTRGKKTFTPSTSQNSQYNDVIRSDAPDRQAMRAVKVDAEGNESEYEKGAAGRGSVNPPTPKDAKYAKGGVTRADGCITKGHTRGRMI
jgi:hypothetical protein